LPQTVIPSGIYPTGTTGTGMLHSIQQLQTTQFQTAVWVVCSPKQDVILAGSHNNVEYSIGTHEIFNEGKRSISQKPWLQHTTCICWRRNNIK